MNHSEDDFFLTDTQFDGDKPVIEEEKEKKVSFFDLLRIETWEITSPIL